MQTKICGIIAVTVLIRFLVVKKYISLKVSWALLLQKLIEIKSTENAILQIPLN